MSALRGYAALIAKATGETHPQVIEKIETHMRSDIFHSTLDWQSAAQLRTGARKAHQLYVAMLGDAATDEQIARAFKRYIIPGDEAASIRGLRAEFKKVSAEVSA